MRPTVKQTFFEPPHINKIWFMVNSAMLALLALGWYNRGWYMDARLIILRRASRDFVLMLCLAMRFPCLALPVLKYPKHTMQPNALSKPPEPSLPSRAIKRKSQGLLIEWQNTTLHSTFMDSTWAQLVILTPTEKSFTVTLIHDKHHLRRHLRAQETRLFHACHGRVLPLGEVLGRLDGFYTRGGLAVATVVVRR
jgi:hypothetical protein